MFEQCRVHTFYGFFNIWIYTNKNITQQMWKVKQALYDASNCNTPCRDNNDRYYGIQHGLKKDCEPYVIYQTHICGPG